MGGKSPPPPKGHSPPPAIVGKGGKGGIGGGGIQGAGGLKKGGGLGQAVSLNGGAASFGSNFNMGGGGASQQGSQSKITESKTKSGELSSGGDAFGFGDLGQMLESSGKKKREISMRNKRALPDPAHGSSSSVIDKRE